MWEIRTDSFHAGRREQLPSKCVSLPQNDRDLVGLMLLNSKNKVFFVYLEKVIQVQV